MSMAAAAATALDPYARVNRPPAPGPCPPPPILAQGSIKCELRFAQDMDGDAWVFGERPFVEDNVSDISKSVHHHRHNDRWAWSLVEQCLKTLSRATRAELLQSNYARGLALRNWEEPGDTDVLQALSTTWSLPVADVRDLYDVMATNNIISHLHVDHVTLPNGRAANIQSPRRHGFYLLLSRVNHACEPSVRLVFPDDDTPSSATHVYTTRPVKKDEAVTMDYVSMVPLEQKRVVLLRDYGFRCLCDRCRPLCALVTCNKPATGHCPCPGKTGYCSTQHQKEDWGRHKKSSEHGV